MKPLKLLQSIERIGASPEDDQDTRLQKTLMMTGSFMFIVAGVLWGILYIALDEPRSGSIPLLYGIVSAMSVSVFAVTRKYRLFRLTQLCLILLLPFLLQISLGGFAEASAVALWALICPLSALLFGQVSSAPYWFSAFLGLMILSGVVQPFAGTENNLSAAAKITFYVLNLSGVSTIVFIQLRYFAFLKERAYRLLHLEQTRSERLLLNVLPKEIAPLLKDDKRTIAEQFDSISVLFADAVGFTPLSTKLSPREIVELLNEVFSYFDSLVEKFELEKIRTIGDNYMAVSGAPRRRPDHAQAISRLALEMLRFREFCENPVARRLRFRIGINSGAAAAGVIGKFKFHYDVWGDAVNTASRMESHGVPGKIQITRSVYELVKDEFVCRPRGPLEIKGKGRMKTWFLEGTAGPG